MKYKDFCFNLVRANAALRVGELSPDDVEVMITKSSGDTLICFMDGEDVVTYYKVD